MRWQWEVWLAEWEWVCWWGWEVGGVGHSWLRLWSQLLLWCLIAADTSKRLKHSVLHWAGYWIHVHLPQFITEWVGGVIRDGGHRVHRPPLCHCLQTVQFQSDYRAGFLYQFTERTGIIGVAASSPAHDSQERTFSSLLRTLNDLLPRKNALLLLFKRRHCVVWPGYFLFDLGCIYPNDNWGQRASCFYESTINSFVLLISGCWQLAMPWVLQGIQG